jgi:hypothetical protein
MSRPVTVASEARFAIEALCRRDVLRRSSPRVARAVQVMGQQWGGFGFGVTFRSNAYWTSLNRAPRRRRRHKQLASGARTMNLHT